MNPFIIILKKSNSNFSNINSKNCNLKRKETYFEINDHVIEYFLRYNLDLIPISSFHLKAITNSFSE